jgi:hypothetical protein
MVQLATNPSDSYYACSGTSGLIAINRCILESSFFQVRRSNIAWFKDFPVLLKEQFLNFVRMLS